MATREDLKQRLVEKLAGLGDERLRELIDYAEFLATRGTVSEDPVLQVAGCLSGMPLSATEIEDELYGHRCP